MKKILFTLLLVAGSFMSQAQTDYFDIVRYEDASGNRYQAIVGEDGFSDCTDSSLTQVAHLRLANTSATEVTISLVSADGSLIPIGAPIANSAGLKTLFLILNGLGEFSKINSSGFNTATAEVNGTSIIF